MKIFAETDRFLLRELLPSDIDGMFELDSDPEVHKYFYQYKEFGPGYSDIFAKPVPTK